MRHMKIRHLGCFAIVIGLLSAGALAAPLDDLYQLGPDSQPHEGVPTGKLTGPLVLESEVFPDTKRNYWIYIPAQYDPKTPASVMVFQDGHSPPSTARAPAAGAMARR